MKKWNFVIDVALCENCNNCFLACKDEHVGNNWPGIAGAQPLHGHRWMNIKRRERGQFPMVDVAYRPTPCMHCDNAPCIKAVKGGAVFKRDDGIVLIDPEKAKGRKEIVNACPYKAIWWNEEEKLPQKCTLCAHLLDEGWKKPRCVQVCPTGALRVVKADDAEMKELVAAEKLEVLNPEFNTSPRVYYKNLYRFAKGFIGGSLAYTRDGLTDCAEGAEVRMLKASTVIAKVESDSFGDFKFDGFDGNGGRYAIEISHPEFGKKTLDVEVNDSLNVGTILLTP